MRIASPYFTFPAAVLFAASFAATIPAQEPAPPSGAPAEHHEHPPAPPPTNLQVLPKTLTGEQVHEIMHGWAAALGTDCSHCHAADPTKTMPNGRPMLNFADDSKPEKATARLMVRMTEEINSQYIAKVDPDEKVMCGTCHRGHVMPPPFVAPTEHQGPPAGTGAKPSSGR